MTRVSAALLALVFFGCSADGARPEIQAPPDASSSHVESPPASVAAPSTSSTTTDAPHACLMLYECGCNASCVVIDQPMSALKAKLPVTIEDGDLKGTQVWVEKNRTDTGTEVFSVSRDDPNAQGHGCGLERAQPFIGYGCSTKDSGNARACTICPS